jgi:5'-3' exonuclease
MGVRGYLWMIQKCIPKSIVSISNYYDSIYIDGNCIIHSVIGDFIGFDEEIIIKAIYSRFESLVKKFDYKQLYIVFDGIPPLPKQYCQKLRRQNKRDEMSTFILPNTRLMKRIETEISNLLSDKIKLCSSDINGEGEQKIIQILKKDPESSILIFTADSDIIILCQILLYTVNKFITVRTSTLTINVNEVHKKMSVKFNIEELLHFCQVCGNDFFPKLTELKDATCQSIYQQGHEISFEKLAATECTCNMDREQVLKYINLKLWYKEYFKTNEYISCDYYEYTTCPCCYCLVKYDNDDLILKNIGNNHLEFVL